MSVTIKTRKQLEDDAIKYLGVMEFSVQEAVDSDCCLRGYVQVGDDQFVESRCYNLYRRPSAKV